MEFEFKVFSRSQGVYDRYRIKKTKTGWRVEHIAINGDCDKEGKPYLYDNFDQDSINYPEELPGYMEFLWKKLDQGNITEQEAQNALSDLAEWVSQTEKNSPGGLFSQHK